VVRHVETIPGQVFSVAESAGLDPTAQGVSFGAEVAANTRGLMFIESTASRIGMVALLPVGMSEISSVTITAAEGQQVKKGDELGYFSYGGSDIVIVFQRNSNVIVLTNADQRHRVGEQIAIAHS
jgi:phosphatidylserine decarboxylase